MASSYTSNYSLCQWAASDKVLRSEFNADNAKIDAALQAVNSRVDGKASTSALNSLKSTVNALSQTVTGQGGTLEHKGNCQIAFSTYVGDGADTKTLTFPRKPLAVLVASDMHLLAVQGSPEVMHVSGGSTMRLRSTWSGNSLTLTHDGNVTSDHARAVANTSGQTYLMLAFYDLS